MKITIYSALEGARVANVVPPAYRELLPDSLDRAHSYSVLLFAHTERDVVPSAPVRRALRRLRSPVAPGGIVAVGTVFTSEALALLAEPDGHVVALRQSHWTDESARARQL